MEKELLKDKATKHIWLFLITIMWPIGLLFITISLMQKQKIFTTDEMRLYVEKTFMGK